MVPTNGRIRTGMRIMERGENKHKTKRPPESEYNNSGRENDEENTKMFLSNSTMVAMITPNDRTPTTTHNTANQTKNTHNSDSRLRLTLRTAAA